MKIYSCMKITFYTDQPIAQYGYTILFNIVFALKEGSVLNSLKQLYGQILPIPQSYMVVLLFVVDGEGSFCKDG